MAGSVTRRVCDVPGFHLRATAARFAMFTPGDGVVVAVSGGADSVALLLGLDALKNEWRLTLQAAHINHQLRGEDAQADEAFVAALCAKYDIALAVYRADVRGLADRAGLSLEDAGRRLRYEYLHTEMAASGAQKIAVAHTQDDNAETVLMNLCRGAGLKGLCGIPPVRGAVVRPLLETSRAAVEAFLAARGADYRIDASNCDPVYTRNRVRHRLMPVIAAQLGEKAPAVIARNALYLADDEAYLAAQARDAFLSCLIRTENAGLDGNGAFTGQADNGCARAGCAENRVALSVPALQALPAALLWRVLREGLAACMGGPVTDVGARDLARVRSLLDGRTGRVAELPHTLRARREYQRLILYRADNMHAAAGRVENADTDERTAGDLAVSGSTAPLVWPLIADAPFSVTLAPDAPVYVPALHKTVRLSLSETTEAPAASFAPIRPGYAHGYTKKLRYDNIQAFFTLRTRLPGDRIYIAGVGRRKLQDYFTDNKTPRPLRDRIPLLAVGGEVLWIMDEKNRVSGLYKPEPDQPSMWVTVY